MGEILAEQIPGAESVSRTDVFRESFAALGITADDSAPVNLCLYHELLCEWNTRMNLTGDTDFDTCLTRHYLDSLAPCADPALFPKGAALIDVGTGAGFPGLPIAFARPDLRVTLLDSLSKRVKFLEAVCTATGRGDIGLRHARAEDGGRDPMLREQFDIATARAVAPLNVLCELLLPFVRVGGRMICYKGPTVSEELPAAQKAAKLLGGGVITLREISIPGEAEWHHHIAVCTKERPTAKAYPRKAGTPGKQPLC